MALSACEPPLVPPEDPVPPAPPIDDPVVPETGGDGGFTTVPAESWDVTAVRKVLRSFAFGGLATDAQIASWAEMEPGEAIVHMLTFSYQNPELSPPEDASAVHSDSLTSLQTLWGSGDADNPVLWSNRLGYSSLTSGFYGYLSLQNMQRTWTQAINTRGINPFLHKITYYLTHYQMAIKGDKISLYRPYYNDVMANLVGRMPLTELIAEASKSAAVAMRYEHKSNIYNNNTQVFVGNDDFAREYFQLFFRINGEGEELYHEDVSIENNALLLTGMNLDRVNFQHSSNRDTDWWAAPLDFTDHVDDISRNVRNTKFHHADCLEILHNQICGSTAGEKIDNLSVVAGQHPEAMRNIPIYIIQVLADDVLSDEEKDVLRKEWQDSNDDLLTFLRGYAVSTLFHANDRVKYQNSFDRNLTLYNALVLDNQEGMTISETGNGVLETMLAQGAIPHMPVHDVFGGQTGLEAVNSTSIFKHAYDEAVEGVGEKLFKYESTYYTDSSKSVEVEWVKDWSVIAPRDASGDFNAAQVVNWLWDRMVADGGKNLDAVARAQLLTLIAHGKDFGLYVAETYPHLGNDADTIYSTSELNQDMDLRVVLDALEATTLPLDDADVDTMKSASANISLAAAFISALPYTFIEEGR